MRPRQGGSGVVTIGRTCSLFTPDGFATVARLSRRNLQCNRIKLRIVTVCVTFQESFELCCAGHEINGSITAAQMRNKLD